MNCKTYGYVRVSTQVQNEARQLAVMRLLELKGGKRFLAAC